jgi:hypothetical protein
MKKRGNLLINIILYLGVLVYVLFLSFSRYDKLSFLSILGFNVVETGCLLGIVLNFRALAKLKVSDIKYHVRMTIFLSMVTAITFNMLVFKNLYNDYLMIPLVISAAFAFYFIYRHQKDKGASDIKEILEK